MSVSTRTAQQGLGFGQIGTTIVVVAVALAMAAAVMLGSLASNQDEPIAAAQGAAPPAFIDHSSRGEFEGVFNSVTAPSNGVAGAYRPDGHGGIELIPANYPSLTWNVDPGIAPRGNDSGFGGLSPDDRDALDSGTRTPGMRPQ
jgi:hypothetical protein